MIYLIGGGSRCGKSTLAQQCRPLVNGQVVAGDGILKGVKSLTTPQQYPEFFSQKERGVVHLTNETPQARLERIRARDKKGWSFHRGYLESAAKKSDDDILLDGNLWPDYITELNSLQLPHRAVFMVDTSPDQTKRLMKIRGGGKKNNWQAHYTDEQLERFAQLNIARSKLTITLCKKHGYPYFDLKDGELGALIRAARRSLIP